MNRPFVALIMIAALATSCATSKIPKERHVTISTKTNFKRNSVSDGYTYYTLDIDSGGKQRSVYWPDRAPRPGSLPKNLSYIVELLEEERRMAIGNDESIFWSPELFRFRNGERVLYDASICHVHEITMKRVLVPISYGFPSFDREYSTAKDTDFPNTGIVLDGCVVDQERPTTRAWVCPTCKKRKNQWEEQRQTEKSG